MRAFKKLSLEEQNQAFYQIGKEGPHQTGWFAASYETIGRQRVRDNIQLLRPFVTERAIRNEQNLYIVD